MRYILIKMALFFRKCGGNCLARKEKPVIDDNINNVKYVNVQ